jgi:ribosome-binding protein aMBF1 (putative translation factor)
MSQVQLADAVKVSASALSSWERGIAVPDAWTSRQLRRFFKQKQAAQDAAARAFAAQQYAQSIAKVSA